MNDTTALTKAHAEMREMVRSLIEHRRRLGSLALSLGSTSAFTEDEADVPPDPETELRSAIECLLCDHLDPLLRGLVGALSGPAGQLVTVVQSLWGVERLLQNVAAELPHSPLEEAMLEGEVAPDEPTEMRTVISAVLTDQVDLAVENLLYAALYTQPKSNHRKFRQSIVSPGRPPGS